MTNLVRVKSKKTGLEFLVNEDVVTDAVTVVEDDKLPAPDSSPTRGGANAGNAGTKKEGSK